MPSAWYVLHSKPNKEEFVRQQLLYKQIEHYYPCLRISPVNPRARKIRPYFPGYLFVYVDLEAPELLPTIQWMPGSAGLILFDGKAAAVPESLIASLKVRLQEYAIRHEQEHQFQPGDKVRVLDGPFAGYEGLFDLNLTGTERVRILLKLLRGQSLKVDLPLTLIKNISKE